MKSLFTLCLLFLMTILVHTNLVAQEKYTLTVEFSNIKNDKGKIWVAVYNTDDGWMKDMVTGDSATISNQTSSINFTLPAGEYAVSVFHDENENKKLDTNSIGIPKEKYGFSNNPKSTFGPPSYSKAKFTLQEDKRINIKF